MTIAIYKPLPLKINNSFLINYFYKNKNHMMKKYKWNGTWELDKFPNHIEREYYVSKNMSYKNYSNIFNKVLKIECESYEYIHMPPGYFMDIHIDAFCYGSRIGILLEGSANLDFYDKEEEDFKYNCSYDYKYPMLFDIRKYHNVSNGDEWRLSFFFNFKETYDIALKKLEYLWI